MRQVVGDWSRKLIAGHLQHFYVREPRQRANELAIYVVEWKLELRDTIRIFVHADAGPKPILARVWEHTAMILRLFTCLCMYVAVCGLAHQNAIRFFLFERAGFFPPPQLALRVEWKTKRG